MKSKEPNEEKEQQPMDLDPATSERQAMKHRISQLEDELQVKEKERLNLAGQFDQQQKELGFLRQKGTSIQTFL